MIRAIRANGEEWGDDTSPDAFSQEGKKPLARQALGEEPSRKRRKRTVHWVNGANTTNVSEPPKVSLDLGENEDSENSPSPTETKLRLKAVTVPPRLFPESSYAGHQSSAPCQPEPFVLKSLLVGTNNH